MRFPRSSGAVIGALGLVVLSSCVDSSVVGPDTNLMPSAAILDGSTGGSDDFYFLPPISDINPTIAGDFNGNLAPGMRVCELDQLGGDCLAKPPVAFFPAGSADVGTNQYQIAWDTDGPETGQMRANTFYRLEILVGDVVQGWIELDPQNPNGPGQSTADAYAFRLGETIPVKFWLSTDVLCVPESYVTECITGAVIDETGGTLALEGAGNKLGVTIFEGSLPGENADPITVTVERIDPAIFLAATGTECLPLFDAPQFGDCFRVKTSPQLTVPLDSPALVSICLDPTALSGIDLSQEQQDQLTMVRFADDGTDVWEALADVAGDCPTQSASLLQVPEDGLFRFAALGINAVADFIGPQPLAARDIRLGGLTSSFSRFRYALPGQMIPTDGNGAVLQTTDSEIVAASINVVDFEGLPVENAVVHFETTDGTLSATEAVSDVNGDALVTWTVDRTTPGAKVLTASALGLLEGAVPEHDTARLFTAESVSLTVTVVGPPSALGQSPDANIDDAIAGEEQTLSVTVTDAAGNPIEGATVAWSCSASCDVPETSDTDAAGQASAGWTPESAGSQSATATIGGVTPADFTATVAPAAAIEPTWSTPPASGTAGTTLADELTVTVTDAFGNPRGGDEVTWTVTAGGGSVSETMNTTDASGVAQVEWTLGEAAGANDVSATVEGFSSDFSVTGSAGDAIQPGGSGSDQTGVVAVVLGAPLTVTVTDEFGNPRAGDIVTWSGDGTLSASSTTTDASGGAQVTWILGTSAGTQSATATAGAFTVSFSATATPGSATSLASTGGGITAPIGSTIPLSVTSADEYGNVREGDAVVWTVTGGGGSISGGAATGADGSATASWTLGATPGLNSATASAAGLTGSFTATGECVDGYGTSSVDGAFGTVEWACASSLNFTANISGGDTPATVYWMNDGARLYMAVRVLRSSMSNANSVRFDFDNDGDGVVEAGDDAIGYDAKGGTVLDQYLDQKCVNRNQSGCGKADVSVDVTGTAMNDGTYTTYELSHPLTGDANGQDFVATPGAVLGFYLTIQMGNGAQGNTQVPGFRQYQTINIVSPGD